MNRRLPAAAGVVAVLFGGGYALTQSRITPLQTTAAAVADAPVRDTVTAHVAAFNKGDYDAVVGYWADDAELIDEDGVTVRGRKAIGESLKPCCEPGSVNTMAAQVKSVKVARGAVLASMRAARGGERFRAGWHTGVTRQVQTSVPLGQVAHRCHARRRTLDQNARRHSPVVR